MKRFTIAVTITAVLLSMLTPIPISDADGPLRRLARRMRNGSMTRSVTTQRWTVAGGNANVANHLAGWPHNINTAGMTHGQMIALHDAQHDLIGPISASQLQLARYNVSCPTGTCPQSTSYSRGVVRHRSRSTVSSCPTGTCPLPQSAPVVTYQPIVAYQQPVAYTPQVTYRPPAVTSPPVFHPTPSRRQMEVITPEIVESRVREEMRESGSFHRQMVRSIRTARQRGEITGRQAVRIRTALLSPAFRTEAQTLALTQLAFSGEADDALQYDENGNIIETAIDWEGFASFLERVLPLLIDLLVRFGLGG